MNKHILSLDIPDTASPYTLRICDSSLYSELLAVDCPLLEITPPGFSAPVYIEPDATPFTLNLGGEDLGFVTTASTDPVMLPDGVYYVKYSVSPKDKVYVEYYHMRVTQLLNSYYKVLCQVRLATCEIDDSYHSNLHKLREIKLYIDAAKAKVEYCHAIKEGMAMYEYAQKLLNDFYKTCCTTC
jgi:hypothetical protein